MAEVQGLRKRRYGSGTREPRRLQIGKIVRARRAEERAASLPLQCESKRSTQGTGGQRVLQSTSGHCDSCRIGGRVLHRNRPESPGALPLARAKGKIDFQNVSFEYT